MAPFVIFFHTGNITLDTKVHVESLKEYLDGLVGYNELRKKASKSKHGPLLIILHHTGMLWIYEVLEAGELCQGFSGIL